MELSLLLGKQIFSMIIMMFIGYGAMKLKALPANSSSVFSAATLYIICPCMIFSAFQMEYSPDKLVGLLIGIGGAIVVHVLYILIINALKKPLKLSQIEQASVIYTNAGNLIVPLVSTILGAEYVFYTSTFMTVQIFLLWTHAYGLVTNDKQIKIKKVLLNPNIIATFAGLIFFFLPVSLPALMTDTISKIGGTIGPVSMLNIGFIMSTISLLEVFKSKRAWLVSFIRLIILPVCYVLIIRICGMITFYPDSKMILLVSLLAAAAPAGATVSQFADLADNDPVSAGKINILSTLCCVITMPVIIMFYQLLCF